MHHALHHVFHFIHVFPGGVDQYILRLIHH
jgi:hypothetical protein